MKVSNEMRRVVAVLRIGHRLVRDDRITTHAALVSRAFGSDRIYMTEVDDSIKETIRGVSKRWGGLTDFKIEIIKNSKALIQKWKNDGGKVIHLTMYGINVDDMIYNIQKQDSDILIIIGAEKVPKEIYELADYNIAIGHQPHSEIAALAIFLDRLFKGKQLKKYFTGAQFKIVPMTRGKKVIEIE